MFLLAGRITPVIATDCDGDRFFVSTSDLGAGRLMFLHGHPDVSDLSNVLAAIGRTRPDWSLKDKTMLDIGAHLGTTSVTATRHFGAGSVIAFEPHPQNYRLLLQNLVANEVQERVRAIPIALSDRDGPAELAVSSFHSGDHRIAPPSPSSTEHVQRIPVKTARLDSLISQGDVDLDEVALCWMDVQGHEAHVLSGATKLLEADIPVVLEYWPDGLRQAGGLGRLEDTVRDNYAHLVDLSECGTDSSEPGLRPSSDILELAPSYPGERYTNILIMK